MKPRQLKPGENVWSGNAVIGVAMQSSAPGGQVNVQLNGNYVDDSRPVLLANGDTRIVNSTDRDQEWRGYRKSDGTLVVLVKVWAHCLYQDAVGTDLRWVLRGTTSGSPDECVVCGLPARVGMLCLDCDLEAHRDLVFEAARQRESLHWMELAEQAVLKGRHRKRRQKHAQQMYERLMQARGNNGRDRE